MPKGVVLVTGGNSGIGFECARELARRGSRVLIASRNQEASEQAVRRIARESGEGSASALALDLGSLASVRAFAKEIEARDLPITALVCNAGLQMNTGPKLTPDGFESTFAVNHLGHFLLTHLLLSRLLANAPARILVVASGVHDPAMKTMMPHPAIPDFETLAVTGGQSKNRFDGRVAYVNSKLCNIWFSYELVRRLEAAKLASDARPLSVNAWEPGLVPGSGLARDYPPALKFIWDWILPGVARVLSLRYPTINPAPKSGAALARAVLDPALERRSGHYYPSHSRWREAPSSDLSYDVGKAGELWQASLRMTRLAPGESPLLGV
ncbi:MAG TPA: SDR family NAD(P)-dependent oxidoreductase [Myxococcota bacterium]|jgi:NAD(P)-dependent dehydrogenase (short-subunit alcohol dehydrogenase family)